MAIEAIKLLIGAKVVRGKLHIKHPRCRCKRVTMLMLNDNYKEFNAVIKAKKIYLVREKDDVIDTVEEVPIDTICCNCVSDVLDYRYVLEYKSKLGTNTRIRFKSLDDALEKGKSMLYDSERHIPLYVAHESDKKNRLWVNEEYFKW